MLLPAYHSILQVTTLNVYLTVLRKRIMTHQCIQKIDDAMVGVQKRGISSHSLQKKQRKTKDPNTTTGVILESLKRMTTRVKDISTCAPIIHLKMH